MALYCSRQLSSLLKTSCFLRNGFSVQPYQLARSFIPTTNATTFMSKPMIHKFYSTEAPVLSKADRLKQAFKDYGATVFLFHIGMSLCSLGVWYLIVSSGIDVPELLRKVNIDESKLQFVSGASTFVVAYGLHKMTAPVRISITLGSAPFIVSYLRRIGVLKIKKITANSTATSTPAVGKTSLPTNPPSRDSKNS